MNADQRFTRAVRALPKGVRERLNAGDAPLDWAALQDPGTGIELAAAARAHVRLPAAAEALVQRLVHDVGIAPGDLVVGAARRGTAVAWVRRAAVEPEGESYRIRNAGGGDVHASVRPEAVAGYATWALELAAAAHETGELWIEAEQRFQATANRRIDHLARCAAVMRAGLTPRPETTIGLADALELAWNGQTFEARASLSRIRPADAPGACAPRENPYAPATGHRLHAYGMGELLWLRALAWHAARGAAAIEPEETLPRTIAVSRVEDVTLADIGTLEARIQAAEEETDALALGPGALALDEEVAELVCAAERLPGAVRRRMGNACGIGFSQGLARLQDADGAGSISAELGAPGPGKTAPKWLEELAAALLMDTGAETRDGVRTGPMHLGPGEGAEADYAVTGVGTRAHGRLTLCGLVQQARLGISFAHEAWNGLAMLRNAVKEGGWILKQGETEGCEFPAGERATLEAVRHIGQALDRVQRIHGHTHGGRSPSALEQASMGADALKEVGAEVRAAAGWPDPAPPNARKPADMARIAHMAETLRGEIRSVANRLIVRNIADKKTEAPDRPRAGRSADAR